MTLYLGCDPGLKGGFALVDDTSAVINAWPMPLSPARRIEAAVVFGFLHDIETISIDRLEHVHFAIERVITLPADADRQDGRQGVLKMGVNFGIIIGVAAGFGWPMDIVPAQTWMKIIHAGMDKTTDTKQRTWTAITRQWPHVAGIVANKSRRGFNDGMADAIGIAEWCRRKYR